MAADLHKQVGGHLLFSWTAGAATRSRQRSPTFGAVVEEDFATLVDAGPRTPGGAPP